MSVIFDYDEILAEEREMLSKRHSLAQTNLTVLLGNDERFSTFVELSQFGLKNQDEIVPDINVYLESLPMVDDPGEDEVRVAKMPDLVIEVLSPTQSLNELLKKIKAYFTLGVKSYWLVMPALEAIRVCSHQLQHYKNFDMNQVGTVDDEVMDIHLPIQKVFRRRN